jgi:hypothetical protein
VARGRDAQWRPCRLQPAPLKDVSDWLGAYREMWEERLDRLEDYLRELQDGHTPPARRARKPRSSGPTR